VTDPSEHDPAKQLWTAVEDYLNDSVVRPDAILESALEAAAAAGLPQISVSAPEGKLLHLLARIRGANAILEIGTLAAYSTIWMARALPVGGKLVTLEFEPLHASVARANLARAGLSHLVDLRLGPAIETLPVLAAERQRFDLIFIDADKASIPQYFDWSMRLANPGALIIVDNVVRDGKVIDTATDDASVRGVRRFNEMVAVEKRVTATTIQTVGSKGYDGFTLAVVN
jgi:predicted O-methyltransferase YrrM